jgi:hypothetical protein
MPEPMWQQQPQAQGRRRGDTMPEARCWMARVPAFSVLVPAFSVLVPAFSVLVPAFSVLVRQGWPQI